MKNYIYIALLLILATGCKKNVDNLSSSAKSAQNIATSSVTPVGQSQVASVKLADQTLTISYNENVSLLIKSDSVQASWAIIFKENFANSQLAKFNFTTVLKTGVTVYDYLEPNLNNVITSTKDTIVNNVSLTKISFIRNILFTNTYSNSNDALNEYNLLLKTNDIIEFSSYLTSDYGSSPTNTTRVGITYTAE